MWLLIGYNRGLDVSESTWLDNVFIRPYNTGRSRSACTGVVDVQTDAMHQFVGIRSIGRIFILLAYNTNQIERSVFASITLSGAVLGKSVVSSDVGDDQHRGAV
jgi:hypothetical protein